MSDPPQTATLVYTAYILYPMKNLNLCLLRIYGDSVRTQIGALDLGHSVRLQLVLEGPRRVEAEALAGRRAARPTRALHGRGLAHRRHLQAEHAAPRVVRVLLTEAGVDDVLRRQQTSRVSTGVSPGRCGARNSITGWRDWQYIWQYI